MQQKKGMQEKILPHLHYRLSVCNLSFDHNQKKDDNIQNQDKMFSFCRLKHINNTVDTGVQTYNKVGLPFAGASIIKYW